MLYVSVCVILSFRHKCMLQAIMFSTTHAARVAHTQANLCRMEASPHSLPSADDSLSPKPAPTAAPQASAPKPEPKCGVTLQTFMETVVWSGKKKFQGSTPPTRETVTSMFF